MICAVFDDIPGWVDRGLVFGHASLTHLNQFRVDVLKIDRSFVGGISSNFDDTAIVRALIGLGKSLGIATVAEEIETMAQADFVRTQGSTSGRDICSAPHNRLSASRP